MTISRLFSRLGLLIIFFFGSSFSCVADITIPGVGGVEIVKTHDCCPDDHHQGEVTEKQQIEALRLDHSPFLPGILPSNESRLFLETVGVETRGDLVLNQGVEIDRWSRFWSETIRLLI